MRSDQKLVVPLYIIYVGINSFLAPSRFFHYLFVILFFCNYLLFLLNTFFERPKIIITFFYRKLHTKYFHVTQFFLEQQYFLRKVQKTVAAAHLPIFWGKRFLRKQYFQKKIGKTIMSNSCKLKI